jgi:tetratricopeptide (TPR) repeat protein
MAQVGDPAAYLRTLARARAKAAAEEWREAAALWEQVVASNPVEGSFWAQLADACCRAQDERRAIAAYQQAVELGAGYPSEAAYRVACCHARLGERERALAWLETAFGMGYRDLEGARGDDDLQPLRDDARFRELVGLADTSGMSRDQGWRFDLALLAREVKRRGYHPFRQVTEARFDTAVRELGDAIPRLTDLQIVVELLKLLRTVGDGHTGLSFDEHPELRQILPLQFFLFEEGLYVIAGDPKHEELLGARVLRFGDRTVDEVMRALDPLIGRDNEHWLKQATPYVMQRLPLLHALGLVPEARQARLALIDRDGQQRAATVATETIASRARSRFPSPAGWLSFPQILATPLPLYLKNTEVPYWFEYLPDTRVVYFQFNSVRDDPSESLADFCARLFAFIDEREVDKLIVDLRWNNGGNTFLEMPLLHGLIRCGKINRRGRLFVIIGRRTFSAAQNGATLIERHTEAIFVGEPTGASPNFVGETVPFDLPYSKLRANVSDLYWQSSWPMDYRTWIAPLIYTPPTFAAYRANRDPAVDAILACREHLPGW